MGGIHIYFYSQKIIRFLNFFKGRLFFQYYFCLNINLNMKNKFILELFGYIPGSVTLGPHSIFAPYPPDDFCAATFAPQLSKK